MRRWGSMPSRSQHSTQPSSWRGEGASCYQRRWRSGAGRWRGELAKALGEHALSVAAFDAAIELARRGRFLLSEALTIRGRALAGRAGEGVGGGSGLHWDEREGKQQLSEVTGRMQGPREPLERLLS